MRSRPFSPDPNDMGIEGPERVSGSMWVVKYSDPPPSYVAALQLCWDEGAPCSFLVLEPGLNNDPSYRGSYRIMNIERFPFGGNDLVNVYFEAVQNG
jgi:hypothetical protein